MIVSKDYEESTYIMLKSDGPYSLGYACFCKQSKIITLDADFSCEELEAIIIFMKAQS